MAWRSFILLIFGINFISVVTNANQCQNIHSIEAEFQPPKDEYFQRLRSLQKGIWGGLWESGKEFRLGPDINNETQDYHYLKALRKGGGYLGIGADQCLTQIAHALPQHSIIYDKNPVVFLYMQVLKALITRADSPEQLIKMSEQIADQTVSEEFLNAIVHELPLRAAINSEIITKLFQQSKIPDNLKKMKARVDQHGEPYTFLANQNLFQAVKDLFIQGRIRILYASHYEPNFQERVSEVFSNKKIKIENYYATNAFATKWAAPHSIGSVEDVIRLHSLPSKARQFNDVYIAEAKYILNRYAVGLNTILPIINRLPFSKDAQIQMSTPDVINTLELPESSYQFLSKHGENPPLYGIPWPYYSVKVADLPKHYDPSESSYHQRILSLIESWKKLEFPDDQP